MYLTTTTLHYKHTYIHLTSIIIYITIKLNHHTGVNHNYKISIYNIYYKQKQNKKRMGVIELGDVTVHNLKQLKKLNQIVFPVSYNDKFYKDILDVGQLAKLGMKILYFRNVVIEKDIITLFFFLNIFLAYYNDIVVGAVCCRIDLSENKRRIYIMTFGCLVPYRKLGVGN